MTGLILPTTTFERKSLDLERRAFDRVLRGIRVIGSWLTEGRDVQPCLVLVPPRVELRPGKCTPCVIPLRSGWAWSFDPEVGDPIHCAQQVNEWLLCGALPGSVHNNRDRLAIYHAVNESLRDLYHMPPFPPERRAREVGEAIVTERETGKVVAHEAVINHD